MPTKRKAASDADSHVKDEDDTPRTPRKKAKTAGGQAKPKAARQGWSDEEVAALWGGIHDLAKANLAALSAIPILKERGRGSSKINNKLDSIFKDAQGGGKTPR